MLSYSSVEAIGNYWCSSCHHPYLGEMQGSFRGCLCNFFHIPQREVSFHSPMYYKLSHPFPQVHELISLANKTKRRCPHNLNWGVTKWKIQFLLCMGNWLLVGQVFQPHCHLLLMGVHWLPKSGGGAWAESPSSAAFSPVLCGPPPLPPLSTFLTWPLWVCWTHFLQKQGWFPACLKMFCSLFWLINRRAVLIPWCFEFFVWGGGCALIRRETKEGNTKFELEVYINYVSESTPDTS